MRAILIFIADGKDEHPRTFGEAALESPVHNPPALQDQPWPFWTYFLPNPYPLMNPLLKQKRIEVES